MESLLCALEEYVVLRCVVCPFWVRCRVGLIKSISIRLGSVHFSQELRLHPAIHASFGKSAQEQRSTYATPKHTLSNPYIRHILRRDTCFSVHLLESMRLTDGEFGISCADPVCEWRTDEDRVVGCMPMLAAGEITELGRVEEEARGEGCLPGHNIYTWNSTDNLSRILAEKHVIQSGLPHPICVFQMSVQLTHLVDFPSALWVELTWPSPRQQLGRVSHGPLGEDIQACEGLTRTNANSPHIL